MPVIKCKICGGNLEIEAGTRYGECAYCGSVMTIPDIADAHTENLYLRAEQFRQMNLFDKAQSAFEEIIARQPDDPEAHWGCLLAKYGIEYVEDPVSHERIPTCHRVQSSSILQDPDYLAACSCAADDYARKLYTAQAARIFEIQRDILDISAQESPYDVFICYKETTEGGVRTQDSILSQELYDYLTEAGLHVFFARISLEGKLGSAYEPIIFAALNSARVMLVIGTAPEFLQAVWVRNEWSRFLLMMKQHPEKVLIPCYHGMNPYDLPEELKMLQAQDMTKIGFLQDLAAGIRTILQQSGENIVQEETVSAVQIEEWLLAAAEAQRNRHYAEACQYCEKILAAEPKNANALFIRLLSRKMVSNEKLLMKKILVRDPDFKDILKYADPSLTYRLQTILLGPDCFYYQTDGENCAGPFLEEQIMDLAKEGIIQPETPVFRGMVTAKQVELGADCFRTAAEREPLAMPKLQWMKFPLQLTCPVKISPSFVIGIILLLLTAGIGYGAYWGWNRYCEYLFGAEMPAMTEAVCTLNDADRIRQCNERKQKILDCWQRMHTNLPRMRNANMLWLYKRKEVIHFLNLAIAYNQVAYPTPAVWRWKEAVAKLHDLQSKLDKISGTHVFVIEHMGGDFIDRALNSSIAELAKQQETPPGKSVAETEKSPSGKTEQRKTDPQTVFKRFI